MHLFYKLSSTNLNSFEPGKINKRKDKLDLRLVKNKIIDLLHTIF